ncbi:MAG: hypothetical protein AUG51_19055 [Acidobacteria bacterium 13_1_20CM_3_53_8]|nr:MAG: hypothetical protein AUG51_19055 [Acidobacteria bacterium 13_1_20CM_3_53_8]
MLFEKSPQKQLTDESLIAPSVRVSQHISGSRIRILHIINDLSIGGAEMTLYKLLSKIDNERFESVVISLKNHGKLRERIEALSVPVYSVSMKSKVPTPTSVLRLIRLARQLDPDLVQGWMAHGNLAAQVVAAFAPCRLPVLWNIRQSLYSLTHEKPMTKAAIRLCARLSKMPVKIFYNSRTSAAQHEAIGYRSENCIVIPNGFDPDRFSTSLEARLSVRRELGLAEDTFLIGLIGRHHWMKDHHNFFQAARLLRAEHPNVHFVLCGRGVVWDNKSLSQEIQQSNLDGRVHLLGERDDIPRLMAALDINVSSSSDEGFPNVIGEGMCCGVPCVATDVSDLPWIVGETGRIVPPRDASALALALKEMIELEAEDRTALGLAARARVMQCFQLKSIIEKYEEVYETTFRQNIYHVQESDFPLSTLINRVTKVGAGRRAVRIHLSKSTDTE